MNFIVWFKVIYINYCVGWLAFGLFVLFFCRHDIVLANNIDQDGIVIPPYSQVGEEGDWTVVYEIGEAGMVIGGGLKVEFPSSWFVNPWPYEKDVQTYDVEQPHYVVVSTSKEGAGVLLSVASYGVDGQYHRFGRTFVGILEGVALEFGDVISVTFANTQAPTIAATEEIQLALDLNGDGNFNSVPGPSIEIQPGAIADLRIVVPSQVMVDEPFGFRVIALDEYENVTRELPEEIHFFSTDPRAALPTASDRADLEGGAQVFTATLRTPDIQYLGVSLGSTLPDSTLSNPVLVQTSVPERYIFWGDLHTHSEISFDGLGRASAAFAYARDTGLDFYALTDHNHAEDGSEGLTDMEWSYTQHLVQTFCDPGNFVSLLGVEWSAPAPYGHRNIIYRHPSGPLFRLRDYSSLQALWQAFSDAQIDALTIPHHTAIVWGNGHSPYVDWSFADGRYQKAVEIYSLHGSSEYYGSPLAYEDVDFAPGCSSNSGSYYVRDGWMVGQKLGVTGSSDNHTAQPGLPYGGLTAVYASDLTRDAIFEALAAGRTYATTGSRMLLEFTADGHWMGEAYMTDTVPRLVVKVAGTDNLDYVELTKLTGGIYDVAYLASDIGSREFTFEFADSALVQPSLYYIRLKQENQVGNRDVMAWSSPIWITPTADLEVDVSTGQNQLSPGQQLTYTITYSNSGLITAKDVDIYVTLPPYITSPSWFGQWANRTRILYNVGDVSAGQSGMLTSTFSVDEDVPWGETTITTTVEITSSSVEVDLDNNLTVDELDLFGYHRVHLPWVVYETSTRPSFRLPR